jgi:hypothetical protein
MSEVADLQNAGRITPGTQYSKCYSLIMVSEHFWQQNRLSLSAELFGCNLAICLVTLLLIVVQRRFQAQHTTPAELLTRPSSFQIFKGLRLILATAGIATLIVTVAPGLMPFQSHIDQNLELSGIALFFMWPVIVAQVVLGVLPLGNKVLSREPVLAWTLLVIACIVFLNIDKAAIGLVYN